MNTFKNENCVSIINDEQILESFRQIFENKFVDTCDDKILIVPQTLNFLEDFQISMNDIVLALKIIQSKQIQR